VLHVVAGDRDLLLAIAGSAGAADFTGQRIEGEHRHGLAQRGRKQVEHDRDADDQAESNLEAAALVKEQVHGAIIK